MTGDMLEAISFHMTRGVPPVQYTVSVRIGSPVVQVESAGVVRRFLWNAKGSRDRFHPYSQRHRELALDRFDALAADEPFAGDDDTLEQLNRELTVRGSKASKRNHGDDRQLPAGDRA